MTGLKPGLTYKFVVKSRNIIGFSDYSESVTILAAQIPDSPTNLTNNPQVTSANQIGLTWIDPLFNGGSDILDYSIWFDNA